ncbi:MAG TPA: cupin domain-containing protein [Burkholderiales bacterium]|jgi:quercetin dioxygenase-like cupin family protein|nr:cupin domain-containing protein [Burkholderiales bacterium]
MRLVALLLFLVGTASAQDAPRSVGKDLLVKQLGDLAGQEAVVRANLYPPGTSNPPHRHDAHVFLHVLEGQLVVQLKGGQPVTLNPGDTYYEAPDDIHMVSRNPSDKVPARALIFMVKKIGAPATTLLKD